MIYGKDNRATSNREQGCLQVGMTASATTLQQQRRKSTTQGANYSNQVKNLRSSKSGTTLNKGKQTTSRANNATANGGANVSAYGMNTN